MTDNTLSAPPRASVHTGAVSAASSGAAGPPWGAPGRPSAELLTAVVVASRELVGASPLGGASPGPAAAPEGSRSAGPSAAEPAVSSWQALRAGLARLPWQDTSLGRLVADLDLTAAELALVVVLLGAVMDGEVGRAVAPEQPERETLGLPLGLLADRLWSSLPERVAAFELVRPDASLVRGRIVQVRTLTDTSHEPLRGRRVSLTDPATRYLLGFAELSETVSRYAALSWPAESIRQVVLPAEHLRQASNLVLHQPAVRRALARWATDPRFGPSVSGGAVLLFSGSSGTGKSLLARALAHESRRPLLSVRTSDLPMEGLAGVLQDIFSEARMHGAMVLLEDCEHLLGKDSPRSSAGLRALDEENQGVLVLTTNYPDRLREAVARRIVLHVPFERPGPTARREIWEVHLPPEVPLAADVNLGVLADRYELTGGQIRNAYVVATNQAVARTPDAPVLDMAALEHGCRSQLPYALERLTTRTPTALGMDDVVLPAEQKDLLVDLLRAIENQAFIMNAWGMGGRLSKGKGIVALFDGPPGTGKTLAAEVLAAAVGMPLHRVNLPDVVSKWVGETEKHIREVFQLARASRAMLLFDEADSLFSARTTETRGSNDRYANMEVNLLLQEIELFPGVCVLTTNLYGALDKALRRRILFRIQFEEPGVAEREAIWETLWPSTMPRAADVDLHALAAAYDMVGGHIKNALLRAAYAARASGDRVTQAHLHAACQRELREIGRVVRDPAAAARDRAARAARLQEQPREAVPVAGAAPTGRGASPGEGTS